MGSGSVTAARACCTTSRSRSRAASSSPLLGSSGCGKTTLLRSICGFVPIEEGRILVSGRDIARLPPERRGTALVFQSYALWPHMSVAQNIGYGLKVRGWSRARIAARVDEMLELLQLPGLAARNVTDLSGGQRQRVALGRALAVEPSLLLLDEPLSNLDARIRQELRHEIRALQQRLGITALHVTHDREEAMVMADRIVVLDQGRIAQVGTPEELFERPASPFVAAFMGADNVVELEAEAQGDRLAGPGGHRITTPPLCRSDRAACISRPASGGPFRAHFRGGAASLVAAGDGRVPGSGAARPGRAVRLSRRRLALRHRGRPGPLPGRRSAAARGRRRRRRGRAAGGAAPLPGRCSRPGHPSMTKAKGEHIMDRRAVVTLVSAAALAAMGGLAARAETVLNVVTAGDQNMVDYVNQYLGPMFEKENPGVKVRAAGTGPGDAGSQKIFEKLDAQAQAGVKSWDIDVAVVHQRMAGTMVKDDLLAKYVGSIDTGKMATRDDTKNALGQPVGGYVMPMFHSQIALAYNPDLVKDPPKTYADLATWVKENPKQFGYNGIKNGDVGRRLRHGLGRGAHAGFQEAL